MKKVKLQLIIKILLLIAMAAVLILAGRNLYHYYSRSKTVSQEVIQTFLPSLNLPLVKKAAGLLQT